MSPCKAVSAWSPSMNSRSIRGCRRSPASWHERPGCSPDIWVGRGKWARKRRCAHFPGRQKDRPWRCPPRRPGLLWISTMPSDPVPVPTPMQTNTASSGRDWAMAWIRNNSPGKRKPKALPVPEHYRRCGSGCSCLHPPVPWVTSGNPTLSDHPNPDLQRPGRIHPTASRINLAFIY